MEWIIITLAIGVILVCAELFIPGGIVGTIGALSLIASLSLVFRRCGAAAGFYYLVGEVLITCLGVYFTSKLVPRTRIGKILFLRTSESDFTSTKDDLSSLVGKEGVAMTLLRPSGTAKIEGRRVDVVTEGDLIPSGCNVRVIEVHGSRVVVRKLD